MSIVTDYKTFLTDASWYQHHGEWNAQELAYLTLGLVGETGEFADALKKIVRKGGFSDEELFHDLLGNAKENILLELGDILWYLTRILDFLNISLNDVRILNTYKLFTRMQGMNESDELPIPMPEWPLKDVSYSEAHTFYRETFGHD